MKISIKPGRVRELAARRGVTLGGLCNQADLNPSHLSKVLAGQHTLSARKRAALLNVLGVEFDEIFDLVDDGDAP
jgi:transcriptional regulator with XRE-family HTH domain